MSGPRAAAFSLCVEQKFFQRSKQLKTIQYTFQRMGFGLVCSDFLTRIRSNWYVNCPRSARGSQALWMYYRFHLLVKWDDVQQILALPSTDSMVFEVVWPSMFVGNLGLSATFCSLPWLFFQLCIYHRPRYEISYVTMKPFVLFFVVQDILVGLARSFPWP